ncbi:MAG: nitroreductase family protein [Clostridiales bacterium]|jgi:nitroreductase|nr:nitroreductase family protein [Clostridiales bacterium]
MNETLRVITERFSCRDFADRRRPEDEDIKQIAEAAVKAPSGMNRQLWRVIVIKNKALIDEMDREGMGVLKEMPDKSLFERIKSRGGRLFYNAPVMIVLAVKRADPPGAELIDLGIAAQNIVLAATSLGLSSLHCGLIGFVFAGEKGGYYKKLLGFHEGYECGMSVLLGYAKCPVAPHEPDFKKISYID